MKQHAVLSRGSGGWKLHVVFFLATKKSMPGTSGSVLKDMNLHQSTYETHNVFVTFRFFPFVTSWFHVCCLVLFAARVLGCTGCNCGGGFGKVVGGFKNSGLQQWVLKWCNLEESCDVLARILHVWRVC